MRSARRRTAGIPRRSRTRGALTVLDVVLLAVLLGVLLAVARLELPGFESKSTPPPPGPSTTAAPPE